MKRLLVFATDTFYPSGGMFDFESDHHDMQDALKEVPLLIKDGRYDHVQIFDTETKILRVYNNLGEKIHEGELK